MAIGHPRRLAKTIRLGVANGDKFMAIPESGGTNAPQVKCDVLECEGEGCHVMIRRPVNVAIPSLCKWCAEKLQRQDVLLKVPLPEPDGKEIDRDAFGMQLYECIKTIGAIMQLRENLADNHVIKRGGPGIKKEWQRRLDDLLLALPNQYGALSADEQTEVTMRYPWIMEL